MKRYWLLIICPVLIMTEACKKWDDHVTVPQEQLSETLLDYIRKDQQLSNFLAYAQQTGLDSLLAASKNITVFAPTNDALGSLPNSVKSNLNELKIYLENHISLNAYFIRDAVDSFRIPMLNGKKIFFMHKKFDEANISESDIYLKNGVLHKIDKAVAPLQNIWEYIQNTKNDYEQNAYISSLNYTAQDTAKAEVDSINPNTGEPVYKPGTGIVTINTYRTKVYDIGNEDSLYTYIVLTNTAFSNEVLQMTPYFKSRSEDTTGRNAKWSVIKDLTVKGIYDPSRLPAILLSKFGVHVSLNSSAIVSSQKLSNGIAYIINASAAVLTEKIPVVYIQGEQPLRFSSTSNDLLSKIFYRQRFNPLTGLSFNDIYMNLGSRGANFYATYSTNELYTTKYKVYWMALNDRVLSGQGDDAYGTDSTLMQTVQVRHRENQDSILFNETAAVLPDTYTETYLGEYTNGDYNWLLSYPQLTADGKNFLINPATKYIRLQAPAVTTNTPYNLTLDYLKFVPVF